MEIVSSSDGLNVVNKQQNEDQLKCVVAFGAKYLDSGLKQAVHYLQLP